MKRVMVRGDIFAFDIGGLLVFVRNGFDEETVTATGATVTA